MSRPMTAGFGRGLLAAAAMLAAASGCVQPEVLVQKSRPLAPEWVLRTPPDTDTHQFYVGRAIAVNTLDERRAMAKAEDDAIDQIARSIIVRVCGESVMQDFENADEARGRHFNADRLKWETKKTVKTDTDVAGMRRVDTYWEIWKIRENADDGIDHTFRRYKFWMLVSFPKKKRDECEEIIRKEVADELDALLKTGEDAYDAGNYEEAVRAYERAISKYPYARGRVAERMARASTELAGKKLKAEDPHEGLRLLQRSYAPSLPGDVKAQLRQCYLECYAEEAAARFADLAKIWKWERVGVGAFLPEEGAEPPGKNLPVQIVHVLARQGEVIPTYRGFSENEGVRLRSGVAVDLESRTAQAAAKSGDDVLIVGTVGSEITTFAYDVAQKRTHPVLTAPNLGGGGRSAGGPAIAESSVSAWDVLASNDPKFRVTVEGEASYRVGDSVTLSLKSNRKCYVVIANCLANGKVHAFIPMLQSRFDFMQPGRTYSVPDENGLPFELVVKGPAGKETFRVIASERPLALDDVIGDTVPEGEFVEALGEQLNRAGSTPWTIAAHSFDVMK